MLRSRRRASVVRLCEPGPRSLGLANLTHLPRSLGTQQRVPGMDRPDACSALAPLFLHWAPGPPTSLPTTPAPPKAMKPLYLKIKPWSTGEFGYVSYCWQMWG